MVKKLYRVLTKDQRDRGIIFSSCLSPYTFEELSGTIHEVHKDDLDKWEKINRLKDDKFFNRSHFKYNIIRS